MSDEPTGEQPRFSGVTTGYVSHPSCGLRGEGEALSENEQAEMTEKAARCALDARRAARTATSAEIEHELGYLDARSRYLRRQRKRLARPV